MRKLIIGFVVLFATAGSLLLVRYSHSQPPGEGERGGRPNRDDERQDAPGQRGPQRGNRNAGGLPTPPVLEALDADGDGEVSAAELKNAPSALKTLDKNKDGELAGDELRPDFGPGGPPPGGPGGPGRGGFGGFDFFGGGGSQELIPPEKVPFKDGVATIPDHATYHKLSYRGEEVMIDTFLADLEFVKFTIDKPTTDDPQLYFINTKTHRAHGMFAGAVGLPRRGAEQMKGVLVYRPMLKSPSGKSGLYTFEFEPFDAYSFKMVKVARDMLVKKMPVLKGNIGYYPRQRAIAKYQEEKSLYDKSDLPVYLDEDLENSDVGYLPLNMAASYGRLRVMAIDERPSPRDVVIYQTLPNEMPRVAGIITAVRQTPLSHVNLRAIQDRVPNAFITQPLENPTIKSLIGKFVAYKVTPDGYELREAKSEEVERHFASVRPAKKQMPPRDLTARSIKKLGDVKFADSKSVGVKAANVSTLRSFGFREGMIPDGHAIPFYFYDEFMKHNGFYKYANDLLANSEFKQDREIQIAKLKEFRKLIEKGTMPTWMMDALEKTHKSFPKGSSVRCRSSTNNEDLPGFSGAGLYDSYTHKPSEGHFSKSIKQVYASLWNFRAFEEREFYRVDHAQAAMGVLVHPNFKGELANGVAVTTDVLYQTEGNYYVNTQVGEDLVTNPEEESIPEELLVDWWKSTNTKVMRQSNRTKNNQALLSKPHLEELRKALGQIHGKFAKLYGKSMEDERFAMEIEFKITKDGRLVIKQARPWVFSSAK